MTEKTITIRFRPDLSSTTFVTPDNITISELKDRILKDISACHKIGLHPKTPKSLLIITLRGKRIDPRVQITHLSLEDDDIITLIRLYQ